MTSVDRNVKVVSRGFDCLKMLFEGSTFTACVNKMFCEGEAIFGH